jgi:hypothetical protein
MPTNYAPVSCPKPVLSSIHSHISLMLATVRREQNLKLFVHFSPSPCYFLLFSVQIEPAPTRYLDSCCSNINQLHAVDSSLRS